MKLLQWTLFIDMLGYREANGSIDSDESAEEFIRFMDENKQALDYTNRDEVKERYKKDVFNLYDYYDISSCFVSDSIIITYKPKEVESLVNEDIKYMHSANALYIICMRLQSLIYNCFSEKGLFLRGGISSKYSYIKDNFAVGEGVIEAYEAESTYAKHPRIVLHPSIESNEKLLDKVKFLGDMMYNGKSIIKKDISDNCLFLDYLGYVLSSSDIKSQAVGQGFVNNPLSVLAQRQVTEKYVREHSQAIKLKLDGLFGRLSDLDCESDEAASIGKVIEKFTWLKGYHNTCIADYDNYEKYHID